ncbi:MAG: glycosyltransferase family 4 protein [Candidatus Melainabacteria bacterium]|nr:glycosyltransferase family 4 protein [Candidatus Melainabacteria bacterium]
MPLPETPNNPNAPEASEESNPPLRPRVLLYGYDYPDKIGGIERYIFLLAQALRNGKRFDPFIVCSHGTPFHRQVQQAGIPHATIPLEPGHRSIFATFNPWRYVCLWRILRQEKPALVHVHWGRVEHAFIRGLGFPVVYTFHSYGAPFNLSICKPGPQRWLVQLTKPLFRALVPHLNRLYFVSGAEQQRMIEEGFVPPNSSTQVMYNGVPLAAFRQQASHTDISALKQSVNIPPEASCVSFICRLDTDKNALAFLDLAERLLAESIKRKRPPLYFLVVGHGDQAPAFAQWQAEHPQGSRMKLLGHQQQVAPWMAASDVTVSVSLQEGFGLRIVEAMACGALPVSYAVGGIPEVLMGPETGTDLAHKLLVPPGNIEAMTQAVLALLDLSPAERQQHLERLQRRADVFDYNRFLQHLEQAYQNVLAERSTQNR